MLYDMEENVTASLLAGVPTVDIMEYGEENWGSKKKNANYKLTTAK